jgi:hypothetical protein
MFHDQTINGSDPIPDACDLVDIRDVRVDKNLSKEQRIVEYLRQIRDPYHFKCGDFTVTARFAENGLSLEDCLQRLLS